MLHAGTLRKAREKDAEVYKEQQDEHVPNNAIVADAPAKVTKTKDGQNVKKTQ